VEEPDSSTASRRSVAVAVLEGHPDALAVALCVEATAVPWPESLPPRQRKVPGVRSMVDLVVREDHVAVAQAWFEVNRSGSGASAVRLLGQPDRWVRLVFTDLRITDGVLLGIVVPEGGDASPAVLDEVRVARPRSVTIRQSRSGEYLDWNETIGLLNGWTREEFLAKKGLDLVHPDEHLLAIEGWLEALEHGRSHPRRWRSLRPDGFAWLEVSFESRLDDPAHDDVLVHVTDVHDEVVARDAIEAQEVLLNRLAQVVPVGLFQMLPDRSVTYANDRLHEILGTGPTGSLDGQLATVLPADRRRVEEALDDVLASGTDHDVEVDVRLPARSGGAGEGVPSEPRRCRFSIRVLQDRVGTVISAIACVSDVTETARRLVELELDLVRHAFHDPVTGLGNRTMLLNRIEEAIAATRETGDEAALLLVDVDGFKVVNDTLGPSVGDDVLRVVSDRLRAIVRPADVVARVGGDEFAVLMEDYIDPDHPRRNAEQVLAACAQPFEIDGHPLRIAVSIGIATSTSAPGGEELLRDADLALHRAKATGRGRYELFELAMHTAAVARVELEASLRQAIDHDQLLAVYQPIHDLATGAVTSVEALVRWQHPTRGLVSPADFIPLAEETGVIVPIGLWVLDQACAEAARWTQTAPTWDSELAGHHGPPRVSVNLSARQLETPGLVDDVAAALERSGLPAGRLVLEITESLLMESSATSFGLLEDLKALGVSLAIDDFGTGYSSLAYLERLPVDILKIDKAFVDRVALGGRHAKLINGILSLSHDLGLVAIAEGIETADQLQALQGLCCPGGQGYLFARPLEAGALRAYLTASPAPAVPGGPPAASGSLSSSDDVWITR
jgi:diguanylate cyclase (GGDEF)-like protein